MGLAVVAHGREHRPCRRRPVRGEPINVHEAGDDRMADDLPVVVLGHDDHGRLALGIEIPPALTEAGGLQPCPVVGREQAGGHDVTPRGQLSYNGAMLELTAVALFSAAIVWSQRATGAWPYLAATSGWALVVLAVTDDPIQREIAGLIGLVIIWIPYLVRRRASAHKDM